MCNEVLGFILMLRTEHKLKIDVDSRIFLSSGFEAVFTPPGGWTEMDGGGEKTQRHRGETGAGGHHGLRSPLVSPEQYTCFSPKNCLKIPLLKI